MPSVRSIAVLSALLSAAPFAWAVTPPLHLDLGQGVTLECLWVTRGKFVQGSPVTEAERGTDETQRTVHLPGDFYLGKTAVTRGQWERFAQETGFRTEAEKGASGGFGWDGAGLSQRKEFTWKNPGFEQSAEDPVCIIAYPDAVAFCQWLSKKSGREVSLPTEAQWEYACRAGTTSAWHNGASTFDAADDIAWSKRNAQNHTHPVTSVKPNGWGFYVGGNVSEWCQDWYAPYPPGDVNYPIQLTPPPGEKARRVVRGGSWSREPKNTRSAARFRLDPLSRNADTGFRVVVAVVVNEPAYAPTAVPPSAATGGSGFSLPREAATPHSAQLTTPQPPVDLDGPMPPPKVHRFKMIRFALKILAGLFCVAMAFIGLIVLFLRSRAKRPGVGAAMPSEPPSPWTGPSVPAAGVRVVKDGFWVRLDSVPPGSRVHYTYRRSQPGTAPANVNDTLIYAPGAEGHFVYTGVEPEAPRITGVESSGNPLSSTSTIVDPGPGSSFGSGFAMGALHQHQHPYGVNPVQPRPPGFSDQSPDTPPRYPSAY